MRMHLERSSLSSFPSPRTSLIGASQRDAPCTSSHIIPGLSLVRLPRSSFVFCFRPLSSSLSSGLLCAISEAPHSIRNAAKEDERGGTRASRPQPPARDGGWRCVCEGYHQQSIEEKHQGEGRNRKFRQQMDLALVLNHSKAKQQGGTLVYRLVRSWCLCVSGSQLWQRRAAQTACSHCQTPSAEWRVQQICGEGVSS